MSGINRTAERLNRHRRIRKKVCGTSDRPRLCVTKTLRHLYAQVIDDTAGVTLLQVSTLEAEVRGTVTGPNTEAAKVLGARLASQALDKNVRTVVFDRGGYPYHGVISALAEACREGGLQL
jgi:large subunit ribosomal protein L18